MTKRKEVNVMLDYESIYDILDQKTPQQVIEFMEDYNRSYVGRHISFNVDPRGYDGAVEIQIWERRLEHDSEYNARIKKEQAEKEKKKKVKQTQEAKELAEYHRLLKKYG